MTLLPEIESALLGAVRRDIAARRRRPRTLRLLSGWLRARQRGVAVVLLALVSAGAATAAVTLSGQPSRPLHGAFVPYGPGGVAIRSEGDAHYTISGIVPSLVPGRVGWCFSYWISGQVRISPRKLEPTGSGSAGCAYAPAVGRPVFAADEMHGPGVHFFFTAPNVAAVRINGKLTVLTRTDPHLPYGLRAGVFEARFDALSPAVVALDHAGHEIPSTSPSLPTVATMSWHGPHPHPAGACALNVRPHTPIRAFGGTAATAVIPAPGIEGRAFFPCVELDLVDRSYSLEAALLLDAAHPGSPPAALPGMRPVTGRPGILDWPNPKAFPDSGDRGLFPGFLSTRPVRPQPLEWDPFRSDVIESLDGGLSAMKVGNAWLVVQGGAGTAQRLAVLTALEPGLINLHPTAPRRPAGARCWLSIRPLPGLILADEGGAQPPEQRPQAGECVVAASMYVDKWPVEAVLASSAPLPSIWQALLRAYHVPTLTIHRGSAWLQITGGSGPAQRNSVAAATSIAMP